MNVLGVLIVVFGAIILWIATRPSWRRPCEQALLSLYNNGRGSAITVDTVALSTHTDRIDPEASGEARRRNGKLEDSGQVN